MTTEAEVKVETTQETVLPKVGDVFIDALGRRLDVTHVDITDRRDRHVQGRIYKSLSTQDSRDYSCPLTTWKAVWLDKLPPRRVRHGGDLG